MICCRGAFLGWVCAKQMLHNRVFAENVVGLQILHNRVFAEIGFLVVRFLYQIKSQPTKHYFAVQKKKKVAQKCHF